MKKTAFLCFLFFHICFFGFSQTDDIDSLLYVLTTAKEDTNKVNLLRDIGVLYANQDPAEAIKYWKQGVALSRKLNFTTGLARNYINISTGFSFLGKYDSTIIFGDSAILYSKKTKNANRLALAYLNMGDGYRILGDLKTALLYCDTAATYASQTDNMDRQARIYDIVSDIYVRQKQYEKAIATAAKALALYIADSNTVMQGSANDDFSTIYQAMGNMDSALFYSQKAISIGEEVEDYKNLSIYYYGSADIYLTLHQLSEAEKYALKSLDIAQQQENNIQLAGVHDLLCKIYLQQKKYPEAIEEAKTAYAFSQLEVSLAPKHEASALLSEAYKNIGDFKNAYYYLDISNKLQDSIASQLLDEQVTGLQSSFEIKEKNKEIVLLNQERELQHQKLFRQQVLFGAAAALLIISLLGIALFINRNRLRQRMKELELRNQIAADLHDEVGSSLSSIHMLSYMASNQNDAVKQKEILTIMNTNTKETMERMGDIVWMIKPGETEAGSLKNKMERFAWEICGTKEIQVDMNIDELEKIKLTMEQRKNIYLIFKEALNNAVKYSGTEKIDIGVAVMNKELLLSVKDYGKGFDSSLIKKGNGLGNMRNRAKELGAEILIIPKIHEGTTVELKMKI